jgi:hypothetical protein
MLQYAVPGNAWQVVQRIVRTIVFCIFIFFFKFHAAKEQRQCLFQFREICTHALKEAVRRRQYWYFCTSKASNLGTLKRVADCQVDSAQHFRRCGEDGALVA